MWYRWYNNECCCETPSRSIMQYAFFFFTNIHPFFLLPLYIIIFFPKHYFYSFLSIVSFVLCSRICTLLSLTILLRKFSIYLDILNDICKGYYSKYQSYLHKANYLIFYKWYDLIRLTCRIPQWNSWPHQKIHCLTIHNLFRFLHLIALFNQ